MCVGGVIMLVITNPKLALLVLAVVPLVVAPIILFGRKVRRLSREAQARMATGVNDGPTNRKTEIPAELAARILTPEKLPQTVQLDWDYIVENQDRWIDRWNREV